LPSSAVLRFTLTFSYAPHIFVSVTPGWLTLDPHVGILASVGGVGPSHHFPLAR